MRDSVSSLQCAVETHAHRINDGGSHGVGHPSQKKSMRNQTGVVLLHDRGSGKVLNEYRSPGYQVFMKKIKGLKLRAVCRDNNRSACGLAGSGTGSPAMRQWNVFLVIRHGTHGWMSLQGRMNIRQESQAQTLHVL